MASQAYYQWETDGRPWRLATPITELAAWAQANGVPNLGTIGDEDHLTDDWPQDHTPFSVTAWPLPLPGYVVTAIDLGNIRGLGQAILDRAKAGWYPWLKYMNFAGHYYDSRTGWEPEPNLDEHVHLSIRTDWVDRSIGAFNPFAPLFSPPTEDDAMLHGQVPVGSAPIIVCTPWDNSQISFGCDLGSGKARLRVAEHVVNQGWYVTMVDISSTDNARKDLPWRVNVDRRCIMRVPIDANDKLDTAVGYLAWWA